MRPTLLGTAVRVGLGLAIGAAAGLGEASATESSITPFVSFKTIAGVTSEGGGDLAIEGDLDLGFNWRPATHLQLVANVEVRDRLSNEGFGDINADLGSLTGVADGVSGGPLHRLEKLSLRWDFDPGVSALIVGRLHFEDYVLDNGLSSKSAIAFANEAFSVKPAIALPRDAFGFVLQHQIAPGWRANFVLGDADRNREFDVFANEAAFTAIEVQHERRQWGGVAHYRAALWSRSDDAHDLGERGGFALSLDQSFGSNAVMMLRYHEVNSALRAAERGAALGLGVGGHTWNRPNDQAGVGVAWLAPSDASRDEQWICETFYRWQASEDVALTPSLQIVAADHHGERNVGTYAGVRLRYRPAS